MADLNRDLKEYLSRDKRNGLPKSSSASSFSKLLNGETKTKWFSTSQDSTQTEDSGGWFSDAQHDPLLSSLSKKQRIVGFMGCILMGVLCFVMAGFYAPVLLLKARKFALLYTLGSLFIVCSFSLLWGPVNHVKHICSAGRLPFTSVYFGSMFATLYFALSVRSTALTALFAAIQVIAVVWYIVSYIPGGQTGLKFFGKIFSYTFTKTVQKTLPV